MSDRNKSQRADSQGGRSHAKPQAAVEGILVLDKPPGITSMRAVEIVRRRAGGVKTGHAGTLDPLATGVLVIALGAATKLIDRLMATTKRYRTVIDLSAFTSTDDSEGEREPVQVATPPEEDAIKAILRERFTGTFDQTPPAFSAVKVGGQRSYKLARKGKAVEIAARPATVHSIELTGFKWPLVELDIHCDKGFYVRALARDLGLALGTGGTCAMIRRTAVGPFTLEVAIALDAVPQPLTQDRLIASEEAMRMVAADGDSGSRERHPG